MARRESATRAFAVVAPMRIDQTNRARPLTFHSAATGRPRTTRSIVHEELFFDAAIDPEDRDVRFRDTQLRGTLDRMIDGALFRAEPIDEPARDDRWSILPSVGF